MKAPTFYLPIIFALRVQTAKLQKPKLLTNIFGNSNTHQNIAFYMGKIPYYAQIVVSQVGEEIKKYLANEQKYQVEKYLKITHMKAPTFYLLIIFALGVQTAKLQRPK